MGTDAQYVRTTVSIREDIYQRLKRSGVPLSKAINEALAKRFKRNNSLFGKYPGLGTDDLRDHEDRV